MWEPVLHPPSSLPRPIGFSNQLVWPSHPAEIMVLAGEEAQFCGQLQETSELHGVAYACVSTSQEAGSGELP